MPKHGWPVSAPAFRDMERCPVVIGMFQPVRVTVEARDNCSSPSSDERRESIKLQLIAGEGPTVWRKGPIAQGASARTGRTCDFVQDGLMGTRVVHSRFGLASVVVASSSCPWR